MEVELREQRSRSANETPRLRGPKIPRSGGAKVRTIEARVTYQNIGKMAQGKEVGVVTGMVLECSQSVRRWSGVSGVRVEIHGYDSAKVRTIEARVTYQNIGKMAQGSEPGVVTGMVLECSQSVQRWSRVSGVRVEIHGYDTCH